jgi:hypothetical protein
MRTRSAGRVSDRIGMPVIATRPRSGVKSPITTRRRVLFPQPLGPTTASVVLAPTVRRGTSSAVAPS